ncbi:hypothetical protein HMJ29_13760 [Hymenobacter taeanensis]|uniref:Uncharacterized protein n=1 Tax=Hymenobacter taeanensis TaxID=2735321 RepID=A0A6M6BIJ2_9BACT|nr:MULTISPECIES: hypothetical protein [Hymenobacter]QJX47947.1 hypothetical protein HMJ29_13760 [Hymenobacter taeanensis]UOQ82604.1 hypothetical protein MUN83_07540 [Hymenobacter sp. 5414T-23]
MKNKRLLVAALMLGAVIGRLSSPGATPIAAAKAAIMLQANPPKPPRYPGGKGHTDPAAKQRVKDEARKYQAVRRSNNDTIRAYYINREVVTDILKQKGCIGLRIYPAYENTVAPLEPSMIIVGVENTGKVPRQDQVNNYQDISSLALKEYIVGQTDDRCPSSCEGTAF